MIPESGLNILKNTINALSETGYEFGGIATNNDGLDDNVDDEDELGGDYQYGITSGKFTKKVNTINSIFNGKSPIDVFIKYPNTIDTKNSHIYFDESDAPKTLKGDKDEIDQASRKFVESILLEEKINIGGKNKKSRKNKKNKKSRNQEKRIK